MNVLHVIPAVSARYGGPSRAIISLSRALLAQQVDVLVATTDADGPNRLSCPLSQLVEYERVSMVLFRRQWSEAYKYSRPMARWLSGHVDQFDLVHIHAVFSHSSLAAASAARNAGVPYIVRPLGSLLPWALRQRKATKNIFWHCGVGKMLAHASAIHCTSPAEKRHADEYIGKSLGFVSPMGVDEPSSAELDVQLTLPFETSERPYVLSLGRLHPVKGLELLIESFLEVTSKAQFSVWRLAIAGEGEPSYVHSLKRLVHELGGCERIIFAGWLNEAQKQLAVRSASLLAQPSFQENFGMAAFEALAHETPVLVSSNMDLATEIERNGAGWVTSLKPGCLSATLSEVMSNEQVRTERGIAGSKLVREQYRWDTVVSKLVEQYQRILTSSLDD